MARFDFEVISLKFKFNGYANADWRKPTLKANWVRGRLDRYLKMFPTKTTIKDYSSFLEEGDIIVNIELSKPICFTDVIHILSRMFEDTGNKLSIEYGEIKKRVTVGILS